MSYYISIFLNILGISPTIYRFLPLMSLCTTCFYVGVISLSQTDDADRKSFVDAGHLNNKTRICLLYEFEKRKGGKNIWNRLEWIINQCSRYSGYTRHLKYLPIGFADEKLFLEFFNDKSDDKSIDCNVVTLGIGDEITYEYVIQTSYPKCKFYGADPFPETGRVFEEIGQVFYTAIDSADFASSDQKKSLNVFRNGTYDWANVQSTNMKVTSLGNFLSKLAKINLVHFMSMDVEGAEYRLLPYLVEDKSKFEQESNRTLICQISVELHGPLSKYQITHNRFEQIFEMIIKKSDFLPLRAAPRFMWGHYQVHFLNVLNEYCVRNFLGP